MKTPKVFALFVLALPFLQVSAQKNHVYMYSSAASEHEQFILAIENSLYDGDNNRPVVKTVRLSNGVTLEYTEQGNVNGTPVVLLHGFPDSRCSYDMVLPHLPASIRAFSLSQRGYGNSDKPEKGYAPKDMAADVAAFLESLNIRQAIIVGHSMGSVVAQQFAIDYPGKTAGIVLFGVF
jgi:non-heme chloroperoxidase